MDRKNVYEMEFLMIGYSGDAKSCADEAVELAKKNRMEEAVGRMQEAENSLSQAHESQAELIGKMINGEEIILNILMVHAQDYLTMATMALSHARQMIDLYKVIYGYETVVFPG